MSIRELLFGVKDDPRPTKTHLLNEAYQYFAEYEDALDEGKIKKKVGRVTITILYVVEERKAQS